VVHRIGDLVRESAARGTLYLPHAIKAMARPTPLLSRTEVEATIDDGEVIEDYPEDVRGHSCLMLHAPQGRPVHVVCSPKVEYLAIITAYVPEPNSWSSDFRRRKR
jgi:Domain of unknown function (DUF4258)